MVYKSFYTIAYYGLYCQKMTFGHLSITILVRSLDCCWNRLLPSLYLLQSKLEERGLILVNNEISYPNGEKDSHVERI
jgi:hypothetical protein